MHKGGIFQLEKTPMSGNLLTSEHPFFLARHPGNSYNEDLHHLSILKPQVSPRTSLLKCGEWNLGWNVVKKEPQRLGHIFVKQKLIEPTDSVETWQLVAMMVNCIDSDCQGILVSRSITLFSFETLGKLLTYMCSFPSSENWGIEAESTSLGDCLKLTN